MATRSEEEGGDAGAATADDAWDQPVQMGSYTGEVWPVEDAATEIMLFWALQEPTLATPNAFVRHTSLMLPTDACGHQLTILQSPSSMSSPGVTGAVMWDSGVVLGKFLEDAVDSGRLVLQGKKVVELGSGCGFVGNHAMHWKCIRHISQFGVHHMQGGNLICWTDSVALWRDCNTPPQCPHHLCVAALMGAQVILTDLLDRLRLLKRNVELNVKKRDARGSAEVCELTWGDDLDSQLIEPQPEIVLGSDVIYSEAAVMDLLSTLKQLSGNSTTIFIAVELRNDAVLEYFLETAMEDFQIGHIAQPEWHPDYRSRRVAIFVLMKKSDKLEQ